MVERPAKILAVDDVPENVRLLEAGADDFIPKLLNHDELRTRPVGERRAASRPLSSASLSARYSPIAVCATTASAPNPPPRDAT